MNILRSSDLSDYSIKEARAKDKIELMMDEGLADWTLENEQKKQADRAKEVSNS